MALLLLCAGFAALGGSVWVVTEGGTRVDMHSCVMNEKLAVGTFAGLVLTCFLTWRYVKKEAELRIKYAGVMDQWSRPTRYGHITHED